MKPTERKVFIISLIVFSVFFITFMIIRPVLDFNTFLITSIPFSLMTFVYSYVAYKRFASMYYVYTIVANICITLLIFQFHGLVK